MSRVYKHFRLKSLSLTESPDFEESFFEFIKDESIAKRKLPFTTLIIGPNGTGKSRLLRVLIDIFNDLYNFRKFARTSFAFNNEYTISYYLDNDLFEVAYNKELPVVIKNGNQLSSPYDLDLPEKGIAAAYSIFEKFTPKETNFLSSTKRSTRYDNEFYEYLGVKTNRNFTFSSAHINNAIDLITHALAEKEFENDLNAVFKVLGFLPKATITYSIRKNRELFTGNVTPESIKEILNDIEFKKAGFSFSTIENLKIAKQHELDLVVDSLNFVSNSFNLKSKFPIDISFEANASNTSFHQLYKHLSTLRKLNLINYDEIIVYKKTRKNTDGAAINLKSMSSGEIQILTSLLSLASVVKDNSLVLIDEPEISLHPNWQMQYIDLLNKIFKSVSGCHFLIATHSHFLAADIPIDSSAILSLTRNNKLDLETEILDPSFGHSAENILYNIFGVATVRNHYFESDVNRLLFLLSSKSDKKKEIRTLVNKFSKFKIAPNDPLSVVINDAEKYLSKQ